MVKWVLAMEVYERVNKVVVPKKVKLKEAEAELAEQMGKLRLKQAELQEVVDKLTAMENEYEAKKAKKKELEDNINLCKLKLERAEKLLSGNAKRIYFIFCRDVEYIRQDSCHTSIQYRFIWDKNKIMQ